MLNKSTLANNCIVYIAYLVINFTGVYFTMVSGGSQSLLWLGAGVSLSAFVIYGWSVWPAIFLGSLSTVAPFIWLKQPFDAWWLYPLLIPIPALVNVSVQSLFSYWLYRRYIGESGFSSTKSILNFVFIVIFIPTMINSLILSNFYHFAGLQVADSAQAFLKGWASVALGDIHGYFILAPIAITWVAMKGKIFNEPVHPIYAVASVFAFVALITASVYLSPTFVYLLLPLAVIISLNLGLKATSLYIFCLSFSLTSLTANGLGPFATQDPSDSLIELLVFVFSIGIPLFILASERNQIRIYQTTLESLVDERTKELSHAIAAKDEFLATISHELRTPLHAILGVVRVIDRSKMTDFLSTRMALVETAGESLLSQINGILSFIRLSDKNEQLPSADFDLKELVYVTSALMEEQAKKAGSSISVAFDKNIDSRLHGSPEQLRQVLFNLLNNAVKYGIGAPITLSIAPTGANKILFSVADEGPGISPEQQPYIFDKFTRLDPQSAQGTGLGLALSKQLVERMGGTIHVISDGLSGTVMEFELRFEQAHQVSTPKAIASEETFSLLVLEDDTVAQTITQDFLQQRGHHVVCVDNAKQAISALKEQEFDALLSDINLPDMSGLELIRHIRLHPVEFKNIYTAALTASVLPNQETEFLESGFQQVLTKPLDHQQLNQFFSDLTRSRLVAEPLPLVNEVFVNTEIATIGPKVYQELVLAYIDDFEVQIEKLTNLSDHLEQQKVLHRLGSAASNLGLIRLQEHYTRLEERLKTHSAFELDLDEIRSLNNASLALFESKIDTKITSKEIA